MAKGPIIAPVLVVAAAVAAILVATLSEEQKLEVYLVHLRNDVSSAPATTMATWHASLIATACTFPLNANISAASHRRLLYSYRAAFHGFAALLSATEASRLASSDAVLALHKDSTARVHTTRTPSFLGLTTLDPTSGSVNVGPLWAASSQGRNSIIGSIDSGIWPDNPSFSDAGLDPITDHRPWNGSCESSFPCNRKIIGARYYFKGYEAYIGQPINESRELKSPLDSNGHGSHTSGTAAGSFVTNASFLGFASGTASGVAPLARIAVYKVCWEMGEVCSFVDILAAFEDAISDGVDVISVSLGSSSSTDYFTDSIAIGSFAAVARGIVVACSAGNDGPLQGTVTNGAPWVLTVAASSLDRDFPAPVTLGSGAVYEGTSLYVGERVTESGLVYAGDAAVDGGNSGIVTNASLCLSADYLNRTEVSGKVVVCEAGYVTSVRKSLVVEEAGGVGTITVNPSIYGEMLQTSSYIAPGTRVGYAEGKAIRQYINGSGGRHPTARIDFDGTRLGGRAPVMAAFSSRGPHLTSISVLKPDITAPGLNVLAAWTAVDSPSELDQDTRRVPFNIISGTSMSCPHVAGLTALLRAAHPTWSPAAIRSALMTTATVLDNTNEAIIDSATSSFADPSAYGSGHVRPNEAVYPGLIYDLGAQDYVDFLCRLNSSLLDVYNGKGAYSCSDPLPRFEDLNYPSFSVVFHQSAGNDSGDAYSATFARRVTNVGGNPKSTYTVSVSPPPSVNVSVEPATLSFDGGHPILSYTVHFAASRLASLPETGYSLAFGSLEWRSEEDLHIVRSPISCLWY